MADPDDSLPEAIYEGPLDDPPWQDFLEALRARMAALAPHLRPALRLQSRVTHVEEQRGVYADAVDHLAVGTILLDERDRVLQTNAKATRRSDAGVGVVRQAELVRLILRSVATLGAG